MAVAIFMAGAAISVIMELTSNWTEQRGQTSGIIMSNLVSDKNGV